MIEYSQQSVAGDFVTARLGGGAHQHDGRRGRGVVGGAALAERLRASVRVGGSVGVSGVSVSVSVRVGGSVSV